MSFQRIWFRLQNGTPRSSETKLKLSLSYCLTLHVLYNTALNPREPAFRHSYLVIVLDTTNVFLKSLGDKTGMPVSKYWSLHGTSLKKYNYLFKAVLHAEVQSRYVKFSQKSLQKKISSKNWKVLNFYSIWFQSKEVDVPDFFFFFFQSFPYLGGINCRNWPGRIPQKCSIDVCYNNNGNDNK